MSKFLKVINGYLRPASETSAPSIYLQAYTPSTTIAANTPITLPASGTYTGVELAVFVNGVFQKVGTDFNYVGTGTKTQVSFTYDLKSTDCIIFKKERNE